MIIHVSISDFRENISDYLDQVAHGVTVVIKDQKKRQELAEVIGKKRFNPRAYRQMLKRVAGTISKKKHPQWSTRSKLEKWLRTSRIAAQRY